MPPFFKILFVSAEVAPLVKVGGLGDVAGSLSKALRRRGHDVRLIMPQYGIVNLNELKPIDRGSLDIPFMGSSEKVKINEVSLKDGTILYLIENNRYFGRHAVYGERDDVERFLLFSLAVMEVPKKINWQPDIFHCHDWHAGMVPALLKIAYKNDPFYSSSASVFTIHNLAYHGWFDDFFAGRAGLHAYMLPSYDPMRDRTYSMMGFGIYHSDVISTVSETYAREVLTPEYGMGFDAFLQRRKNSFFGIRNGIDYEQFNPATDDEIAIKYDINNLDRRIGNKLALQEKVSLPVNEKIPLVGMAGRLVEQKGPDIAAEALEALLPETDMQFILQGIGETCYELLVAKMESLHSRKARIFLVFDFSLAQLIFAGCDIFLMPSRFEPCGLAHLIAMHYGAIPVVRRTGGLAETVPDCPPDLSTGLGFVFDGYNADELVRALKRALNAFQKKDAWRKLMVRAMQADFSWSASLPRYEALYETAKRESLKRKRA
jgi:starch synthase